MLITAVEVTLLSYKSYRFYERASVELKPDFLMLDLTIKGYLYKFQKCPKIGCVKYGMLNVSLKYFEKIWIKGNFFALCGRRSDYWEVEIRARNTLWMSKRVC